MTHKVLKSQLVPVEQKIEMAQTGFGIVVAGYIKELQAWNDHMILARALDDIPLPPRPQWGDYAASKDPAAEYMRDAEAWEIQKRSRHMPYPQPEAPADVVASVKTVITEDGRVTFMPDFEVINDDPTPDQVLAGMKDDLLAQVATAEASAIEKLLPPMGKRRLLDLRESDIIAADAGRIKEVLKKPLKEGETINVARLRPVGDTKFLADRQAMRDKIEKVQRRAAEAFAEIEDLTLDEVKTFKLPTFD